VESDDGVNLHGAACGDESGDGGHGGESGCNGCECDGVVRGDAEEQVADQVRGGERAGDSDKEADECKEQSFAQDHTKNRAARSAERDAYSDFVCAARDGMGNHAEDSGSGENEGHGGKKTEQGGAKSLLRNGIALRRDSGFRRLILALALFDVAPVDLGEIELVAVGIFEPDEGTGLAFVDDVALEMNALGFQRADGVAE